MDNIKSTLKYSKLGYLHDMGDISNRDTIQEKIIKVI